MLNICTTCSKVLREGDAVRAEVESYYHELRSTVTYALSKDMTCIPGTLRHKNCQWPQTGEPEGD